jgi:outer membrane protein assembly factor BamA
LRLHVLVWITGIVLALGLSRSAQGQVVIPLPPVPPVAPKAWQPTVEPAVDVTGLEGRRIVRITVTLRENIWTDATVPPITALKTGDPLTAAAARRALAELLESGRFARGRASAVPEGPGVALILEMTPRKLVKRLELDLHGAALERDELLREAGLSVGRELVGSDIDEITGRMVRYLAVHGFPSAKVDIQTRETDDPSLTLVIVDVLPGRPRTLGNVEYYVFGASRDRVMPMTGAYTVKAGDRADETALASADTALEHALRANGYFRAHVSHDVVWVGDKPKSEGRVVLRVRLDTGSLSVPRFEGNEHYDSSALEGALGLETENDRSSSHLGDKIRAFYVKRGFFDARVQVETRGAETDPVQLLVFHIEERARVQVVARRYPCLKAEVVRRLSGGGPRSSQEIGTEIDSYLEDELPGAELFVGPDPKGVARTLDSSSAGSAGGTRTAAMMLRPDGTYVEDVYERAAEHVQELYRNEGFLHALVGPVQVVRARCDPRSPPGRCTPMPLPPLAEECTYDAAGLPLPAPPLDASFSCRTDDARGVDCAPTVQLVIPVKLGPQTRLWDVTFSGLKTQSERDVAEAARVPLGDPVSTQLLDDARRRLIEYYKELGYAFVDVKYTLEPSLDGTRARVHFDVTEGDQVIVNAIEIRGLAETHAGVVRRRVALEVGEPYRTSAIRKTQEQIATLGVFSSVTVGLTDAAVPEPSKTVVIEVVERLPHYIEVRPGFSTGEGVRGTLEYDERNLGGAAVGATFRAQLSYLPNFLILDPQVATNYNQIQDRLARRITLSGTFPDLGVFGLGPPWRAQLDGIYVRDLERDFTLDKVSAFGSLVYRPSREVQIVLGTSVELNDVRLFQFNSIAAYLACNPKGFDPALGALLRIPDGTSIVFSQRASIAWDRRDNAFNAKKGTYVYLGAELVNSVPEGAAVSPNVPSTCTIPDPTNPVVEAALAPAPQAFSHFVRLTQTFAGYVPITRNISLALELRLGENVRTAACDYVNAQPGTNYPTYCTYPDRLFFMGGFDSMRGWLQDTFMPQEYADEIAANKNLCMNSSNSCNIPLRGGNLMINPRAELRFPIRAPFDGAIFADFGNLWVDPADLFNNVKAFTLRADIGPGVRVQTPVGPLVFDYGINVTRRPFEDVGAFHFAIGLF